MKKYFISIFLILLALQSIQSQTVKKKWNAIASFGTSYYKGNVNKFDLRSEGNLAHADSVFESSAFYKVIYGESNHIRNNQEYSGGLKFDWHPEHDISPFIATTAYSNEYNGYKLRLSALAGAKYTFNWIKKGSYSISAAFQYDVEKYVEPKKPNEIKKPDKDKLRLSIRPKIKFKLTDAITIEHISYFKPKIDELNNIQIESVTSINNKISNYVYFNVKYDYYYDSNPPSSAFVTDNGSIVASIVIKL